MFSHSQWSVAHAHVAEQKLPVLGAGFHLCGSLRELRLIENCLHKLADEKKRKEEKMKIKINAGIRQPIEKPNIICKQPQITQEN